MSETKSFKIGVTRHSFTNEYCSFQWSLEDMRQPAALLGGGVEIVGPAHHRGFPEVSDEFERTFKSSVERNELTPTSYGSYPDPFMLPGRDLTPDELVEYTIPQLRGAAKTQISRMPAILRPPAICGCTNHRPEAHSGLACYAER